MVKNMIKIIMKIGFAKYMEERMFQAVCPDRAGK
jgi:hypothetical protein